MPRENVPTLKQETVPKRGVEIKPTIQPEFKESFQETDSTMFTCDPRLIEAIPSSKAEWVST